MADIEALKPSNTGWLIADVVADTAAFGWARTAVDPELLAMLADPQWQPYVVFPGEFVAAGRVVREMQAHEAPTGEAEADKPTKRPLFVLLDATWPEARKMFRKSPYLDHLPVLSLQLEQISRYRLRRSKRDDHLHVRGCSFVSGPGRRAVGRADPGGLSGCLHPPLLAGQKPVAN